MERLRAAFNARCMVMVAGKQHQTASFEGRASGPPETTDVASLTKTLAPSPSGELSDPKGTFNPSTFQFYLMSSSGRVRGQVFAGQIAGGAH